MLANRAKLVNWPQPSAAADRVNKSETHDIVALELSEHVRSAELSFEAVANRVGESRAFSISLGH